MVTETIERTIQYFGLLKVPTDIKNIKWWRLSADIIRPHLSEYRNDKYPVPQGFWGYVQAMYAGRVLHTYRISYKNEIVAYNIDTDLFLQQNVSCSLEAVLTTFVNFAIALNIPPIERINPIKNWRNQSFPIDEFKIRLLAENIVFRFTYEFEAQETCDVPLSIPPQTPPPPPTPPPTPVPPQTGNEGIPPISPPYEGPDDNGETYNPDPNPEPEFPQGERCAIYEVSGTITSNQTGTQNRTSRFYGQIEDFFFSPQDNTGNKASIIIKCHGIPLPEGDNICQETIQEYIFLQVGLGEYVSHTLGAVTLVEPAPTP